VTLNERNGERPSMIDVPRPAKFNGSLDSKAIENFLFQVEDYLDIQNVTLEDLRNKAAATLLDGDAITWWRRKRNDMERGQCMIDTFCDFKIELRNYFMLRNAQRQAYKMVSDLKHTGLLQDYVRTFQKLMVEVPNMPDEDKPNWFIVGL
jgi:hypothetical protein